MTIYNYAIIGCCIALLVMILVSDITIFTSQIESVQTLNKPAEHTSGYKLSAAEELASSVWCLNRFDSTKVCKFKNLYYIPNFKEHLLFLINEFSIVSGAQDLKYLSPSTIQHHNGLYLKIVMIKSTEYLLKQNFSFLDSNLFIMKRFKPDNIMHVIHDDLLPLFVTYKELCGGNITLCLSTHRLLIFDNNDYGPYFEWYMQFSSYKPILISTEKSPLWIKRGVFGLSNSSVWFQYGFRKPQGPVFNDYINTLMLQEFTDFMKNQFGIKSEEVRTKDLDSIVFFSRKVNRKILNEGIVEDKIKTITQTVRKTNIKIITLDLSTNNTHSIINSLQRSQLLVGMHGSAMILAIFMQPGSHIIELFPFGIQPEFVSPLRALCTLQNIYYHYESWMNLDESNTRTHPEYPPLLGGLAHLENAKKRDIMKVKKVPAVECCHNPVYLFRMFQDTVVDESFFSLFQKVVSNYNGMNSQEASVKTLIMVMDMWYFPPPIFNLKCKCFSGVLKLNWDYPFLYEGIEFSIAISNGISIASKTTYFSITIGRCVLEVSDSSHTSFSVWVKAVDGDKESIDSFVRCTISDGGIY